MVTKLDRLARSVLVALAITSEWGIVWAGEAAIATAAAAVIVTCRPNSPHRHHDVTPGVS